MACPVRRHVGKFLEAMAKAGAAAVGRGIHLPAVPIVLTLIIATASRVLYEAALELRERYRLRRAFGAYVSPRILARVARLNVALAGEGEEPLAIGIGMHTGDAVVGNMGSAARHKLGQKAISGHQPAEVYGWRPDTDASGPKEA